MAVDTVEEIIATNSTFLSGQSNNFTSLDITGCSVSGSGDVDDMGDFSGSGSGDGEFTSYRPLTCSALDGIKSEAIMRKFKHLMEDIYKSRIERVLYHTTHIIWAIIYIFHTNRAGLAPQIRAQYNM